MTKKVVNTLVIDLDNTIFDWFAVWYGSFHPLYQEVIAKSGRPVHEVEADVRRVHQKQRTSEYTFLLEDLDVLREVKGARRYQGAIRKRLASVRECTSIGACGFTQPYFGAYGTSRIPGHASSPTQS